MRGFRKFRPCEVRINKQVARGGFRDDADIFIRGNEFSINDSEIAFSFDLNILDIEDTAPIYL